MTAAPVSAEVRSALLRDLDSGLHGAVLLFFRRALSVRDFCFFSAFLWARFSSRRCSTWFDAVTGVCRIYNQNHLADPEFLTVTPLLLRLLELALTVAEAGLLFQGPRGGGEVQITR